MTTKVIVVRGTISRITKKYVGIYVRKTDQKKLENMIGKKVEAVLFIEEVGGDGNNKEL
jgi:hypothetical protein